MDGNMESGKRITPPVGWFPQGGSGAGDGAPPAAIEPVVPPVTTPPATPPAGIVSPPNVGDFEEMRKTLPAELQNNETIKNSKSFTSLAEQLVNSQKLIGSKVSIPKDGDEKGWNEFYGKLGRPETADKYTIPLYLKIPVWCVMKR